MSLKGRKWTVTLPARGRQVSAPRPDAQPLVTVNSTGDPSLIRVLPTLQRTSRLSESK